MVFLYLVADLEKCEGHSPTFPAGVKSYFLRNCNLGLRRKVLTLVENNKIFDRKRCCLIFLVANVDMKLKFSVLCYYKKSKRLDRKRKT